MRPITRRGEMRRGGRPSISRVKWRFRRNISGTLRLSPRMKGLWSMMKRLLGALSDDQRSIIAEARSDYEARMAEREILFHAAQRKAQSPEELDRLNEEFRRDRERFANDRDAKIRDIRG